MKRRADIQGLRALAVAVVVVFHIDRELLPGGFVGVDLFFVISGFVITGLLLAGFRKRKRIALLPFYARRFLRIIPAAAFVGVVTLVASVLILSPLEVADTERSAITSSLFVSNIRFATETLSYAGGALNDDPFLHYWTLGVEEQFYLVWPLVLILGLALPRLFRRTTDAALPVLLSVLLILSFGLAWFYTDRSQPYAFFLLPCRFWEFAAGGLLAVAVTRNKLEAGTRMATSASVVGVALIGWACISFDATTSFPGPAAAIPVLGAVLLLVGGTVEHPVTKLLSSRPFGWVGDRSYSIYLWHWPFLVLGTLVLGSNAVSTKFGLAALAVLAAAGTFRFVENPIRLNPRLRRRSRRGITVGLVGIAVFLVTSVAADRRTADQLLAPQQAELVAARASTPHAPGCQLTFSQTSYSKESCVFGAEKPAGTVVLFGDSHATQLLPAVEEAIPQDWAVSLRSKDACPPAEVDTSVAAFPGRVYRECNQWRAEVIDEIRTSKPDAVILGSSLGYATDELTGGADGLAAGMRKMVEEIQAAGAPVLSVQGIPEPGFDVPVCLSRLASNSPIPSNCEVEKSVAIPADVDGPMAEAVASGGGLSIDVSNVFCDDTSCATRLGGELVYRDADHITTFASAQLGVEVAAGLRRTLESGAGGSAEPER